MREADCSELCRCPSYDRGKGGRQHTTPEEKSTKEGMRQNAHENDRNEPMTLALLLAGNTSCDVKQAPRSKSRVDLACLSPRCLPHATAPMLTSSAPRDLFYSRCTAPAPAVKNKGGKQGKRLF